METRQESWIEAACAWLRRNSGEGAAEAVGQALAAAPRDELGMLIEVLIANFDELNVSPQRLRILMQAMAARLLSERNSATGSTGSTGSTGYEAQRRGGGASAAPADDDSEAALEAGSLVKLYELLGESDATSAAHALQMLAAQKSSDAISELSAILQHDPPRDWKLVALALSPLWSAGPEILEQFFEELATAACQPSTLSVLLDLAGYAQRTGKLAEHPWEHRADEFAALLGSVTARLHGLEREPRKFGSDVQEVQRVLADSVALSVSLCDGLGLMRSEQSAESLLRALELSHRRIQTEAAGALARLGNSAGKQRIIELASDPVARLRAVNYAEELGFAEQIDESYRLPVSLAESELVSWLSQADHFAVPPSHIELLDSRTMYWPSYEEPRDCYLFRYEYELGTGVLSNIGIAGPVTHAFQADLQSLELDDVYAAFAGWQAEHDEMYEIPMPLLNAPQRREADRLLRHLEEHQLEIVEAIALTFFFGELAILAEVQLGGQRAAAITDGLELLHQRLSSSPNSLTPSMLLAIYRGRKLLRTFNS